ncbi:hypothetical protein Agabi119p4_3794 [Agaricus bisporus var. burnettii]|uniref:non-specific serine/threonine protein kinase n=2 Tax=Agaricus bisporus var. burnettii TaxID=192524 RepID=A0A8H7F5G9_AGABI|nr:hypothetical protein Agabi119p4_3794 [Agaricus bisporus var. burnettii]
MGFLAIWRCCSLAAATQPARSLNTHPPHRNKRPWEGTDLNDSAKRHRGKDDPRDWRDVHLKSPAHRSPGRRTSPDRRDYRRRKSRERRDEPYRRPREYSRDRSRRGREHSRRRDGSHRRDDHGSRRSASPRPPCPPQDDEKEEGEISPRPPSRASSGQASRDTDTAKREDLPKVSESQPDAEIEIPSTPPPVEDIIAARRAKRQAILAKYSGQASQNASPSPMPGNSVDSPLASSAILGSTSPPREIRAPVSSGSQMNGHRDSSPSKSPEPTEFALAKGEEDDSGAPEREGADGVQVLAADYDPSLDRREDEQKRIRDTVHPKGGAIEEEEVEEEVEDDVDDMFAVAMGDKKPRRVTKVSKKKTGAPALITTATLDTAADPEGYYSVILGEQLDGGRYQVFSSLGKGMFANVVRARILQGEPGDSGKEVAIKIVRCQESMYKAGLKETQILNKLKQSDPEDKKHIVRIDRTFEHRGHLCLVFESLSMNLREVVKRFGKDVGLNIRAVRAYAHQLFLALSLLRKLNIIHADIKPDNILVNEQKTLVKLCDLGSASDAAENDITPYLVSRFYRAPEIILGVPYDMALDIWSMGCTLYELYTGKILFPGRSNNQMLLLMMEVKGRFNTKMIKKAKFGDLYFDEMGGFQSVDKDKVTGSDVIRNVHISKASRDLRTRLMPPASAKLKDDESKMISSFIDLLDKCLALDPARRIQPREALNHPFIRGQA